MGCTASLGVVLSMVAFLTLFVGNMTMWNKATFPQIEDVSEGGAALNELHILVGMAVLILVLPILGVIVMTFNRSVPRLDRSAVSTVRLRAMDSAKRGLSTLPVVGSNGYGKVEMTGRIPSGDGDDVNYDVYN